jgi:peptidoglycan/LPS O-acetylase OafA/YrhL
MPAVHAEPAALAPASSPRRGLRHLVALDGLRGIAIVMVMLHNLTLTRAPSAPLLGQALEWGWVGVQLFFVMSGYLITRNLLAMPMTPSALTAFMIRRCLRIVPICYALLAAYFYVVPLLFDAPSIVAAREHQRTYWLFLSNWTEPFGLAAPGLGHLWSLGVEVQFYLLWPLVVLLTGTRRFARPCVAVIVLGIVAAASLRAGGASFMAVYKFTVTRMAALGMGALVAALGTRPGVGARIPVRALVWGSMLTLLAIVVWRRGFDFRDAVVEIVGLNVVAFLFALWLLPIVGVTGVTGVQGNLAVRIPSWPWLQSVGRVSYAMYILHYPLHWAAMKRFYPRLLAADGVVSTPRLAAYVVIAGVATYALALLTWRVVERPALGLKRFFPLTGVRSPTIRVDALGAQGRLDQ